VLIIGRSKLYYTAPGIFTPSGAQVERRKIIEKWVAPRARHDIFFVPAGIQTPDGLACKLVTIMTMQSGSII